MRRQACPAVVRSRPNTRPTAARLAAQATCARYIASWRDRAVRGERRVGASISEAGKPKAAAEQRFAEHPGADGAPLASIGQGVTAEDQRRADERIPHLIETPARRSGGDAWHVAAHP